MRNWLCVEPATSIKRYVQIIRFGDFRWDLLHCRYHWFDLPDFISPFTSTRSSNLPMSSSQGPNISSAPCANGWHRKKYACPPSPQWSNICIWKMFSPSRMGRDSESTWRHMRRIAQLRLTWGILMGLSWQTRSRCIIVQIYHLGGRNRVNELRWIRGY